MMGRNKGKQAPMIPGEDSIIGQYKVGVNRSFRQWVSQGRYCWACRYSYKFNPRHQSWTLEVEGRYVPSISDEIMKESLPTAILKKNMSFATLAAMILCCVSIDFLIACKRGLQYS